MKRRQNPNQTRHHRLLGHDYSTPGYYFVTFGTHDGLELLGSIEAGIVQLSATGKAVSQLILNLPYSYRDVTVDCFTVMPNHVHLLIYLSLENSALISQIIRSVKGPSTVLHRQASHGRLRSPLWHKGFHDEVVRNDEHLDQVRRYIAENPIRWKNDDFWR